MDALKNEFQRRLHGQVALEDAEGFLRPDDLAGGGAQAEAAGMAQLLCLGEIGLALSQRVLGLLALGDVLASDQNDQLAVGPPHGLGIFTHPQHRAVFPDLANLPGVGLVDGLEAEPDAFADEVMVFFKEDVEHGLADQLFRRVAELCGAERVDVQYGARRLDHEVHDRVMLEHLAPLLHGVK